MSDQITQKLDEMEGLTYSCSVPPGVSVAIHTDLLLAETRRELRTCIAALRAVLTQHHLHDCSPEHGSGCSPCWSEGLCEGCSEDWPCPTVEAVLNTLEVTP